MKLLLCDLLSHECIQNGLLGFEWVGVFVVVCCVVVGFLKLDSVNGGGEQWRPNGCCGLVPRGNACGF